MRRYLKVKNGITMIGLVVTILVLIILVRSKYKLYFTEKKV